MKPDRAVFDTNFFVSLILSRRLNELVVWVKDEHLAIYVCPELTDELEEVLNRKHIKKHLNEPVSTYIKFIEKITQTSTIDKRFDRAPDLKDNYLFDLAYTVKSHYIVTGDKPLLNMKQVNKIKLISPAEFKKKMKAV